MPLINKTDLLDNIKRTIDTLQAHGDANYIRGLRDAMRIVEAAPAIEQERKKGRWIYEGARGRFPVCRCSVCGNRENADWAVLLDNVNYCPNCGTEMGGEDDEA